MTAEPKWWHGTPGTLKWAFARIRDLEADVREWKDRWIRKDIQVNNLITEHNAERNRTRAEVERLRTVLEAEGFDRRVIQGGGRESGHAGSHPVRVAPGSVSAANPAAREECSECGHDHHRYTDGIGAYCVAAVSPGNVCWCSARKEAGR